MAVVTLEKALKEIDAGKRAPVYLLHGDEYLTREGAGKLIDALVPTASRALNVEVLTDDAAPGQLALALTTVSLFGGLKVVVVHDVRAFIDKQATGRLGQRSLDAWQGGDMPRAARLLLQAVAAIGEDRAFLERAGRGEASDAERERLVEGADPESDRWLREVAARAVRDELELPRAGGGQAYEPLLERGIPDGACLILTAEAVDERRTLFKRIREQGAVIDCGVRGKGAWDTQMRPEAARSRIAAVAAGAGKELDEAATRRILEQTGFSVRALDSELEKLFLYVGERRRVGMEDVEAVLVNSREANSVALANALSEGDVARALLALRSLLTQREPAPKILGAIAAEIRNLLLARAVLDARLNGRLDASLPYPAFQARVLPKLKEAGAEPASCERLAGMHPFRAFNMLRAAARFPLPGLLLALEEIHEADLHLKSGGQSEEIVLGRLLAQICGGAA